MPFDMMMNNRMMMLIVVDNSEHRHIEHLKRELNFMKTKTCEWSFVGEGKRSKLMRRKTYEAVERI